MRGNSFFILLVDGIQFRDVLNYSVKTNLSTFVKTWGVSEQKGVWPYELYQTVEEICSAKEFPAYQTFKSSLSSNKALEEHKQQAKRLYYEMLTRNEITNSREFFILFDHSLDQAVFDEVFDWYVEPALFLSTRKMYNEKQEAKEWSSMMDLLEWYNNNDVIILEAALTKCMASFKEYFNVTAIDKLRKVLSNINQQLLYSKIKYDF